MGGRLELHGRRAVSWTRLAATADGGDGASLLVGSSVASLAASASDNVGVVAVEFFVGDKLVCRDEAAPFSCAARLPDGLVAGARAPFEVGQ